MLYTKWLLSEKIRTQGKNVQIPLLKIYDKLNDWETL